MTNKPTTVMSPSIPSLFSSFFEPWNEWFNDRTFGKTLSVPRVNLRESKDKYTLSVAAPGLHKKDFNIDVNDGFLTISAEHENEKESGEEEYHRQEYNYSSFSRSFTLPAAVQADKIEANYDGGVLRIVIPKKEIAAPAAEKRIEVK